MFNLRDPFTLAFLSPNWYELSSAVIKILWLPRGRSLKLFTFLFSEILPFTWSKIIRPLSFSGRLILQFNKSFLSLSLKLSERLNNILLESWWRLKLLSILIGFGGRKFGGLFLTGSQILEIGDSTESKFSFVSSTTLVVVHISIGIPYFILVDKLLGKS